MRSHRCPVPVRRASTTHVVARAPIPEPSGYPAWRTAEDGLREIHVRTDPRRARTSCWLVSCSHPRAASCVRTIQHPHRVGAMHVHTLVQPIRFICDRTPLCGWHQLPSARLAVCQRAPVGGITHARARRAVPGRDLLCLSRTSRTVPHRSAGPLLHPRALRPGACAPPSSREKRSPPVGQVPAVRGKVTCSPPWPGTVRVCMSRA